jgi:penicillin-binding protein 1A
MVGFDREMRRIARIVGFIFATGTLLFVVAAALFGGVLWKYEQELPDYSVLPRRRSRK